MQRMDIKAIRERHGVSQAELASRLGVTQSTVSRLETGELKINQRTRLAMEALFPEAAAA